MALKDELPQQLYDELRDELIDDVKVELEKQFVSWPEYWCGKFQGFTIEGLEEITKEDEAKKYFVDKSRVIDYARAILMMCDGL